MPLPVSTMLQLYICTANSTMPIAPPGVPGVSSCMSNGVPVNLIGNVSTHLTVNPGFGLISCLVNGIPALPEISLPVGICMFPVVHPPTPFLPNPLNIACLM